MPGNGDMARLKFPEKGDAAEVRDQTDPGLPGLLVSIVIVCCRFRRGPDGSGVRSVFCALDLTDRCPSLHLCRKAACIVAVWFGVDVLPFLFLHFFIRKIFP